MAHPSLKDGIPKKIQWSECKGCGKRILFVEVKRASDGKMVPVPLDPVPAIYHIAYNEDGTAQAVRASRERVMVNHFATCPKANQFSGGKKT